MYNFNKRFFTKHNFPKTSSKKKNRNNSPSVTQRILTSEHFLVTFISTAPNRINAINSINSKIALHDFRTERNIAHGARNKSARKNDNKWKIFIHSEVFPGTR